MQIFFALPLAYVEKKQTNICSTSTTYPKGTLRRYGRTFVRIASISR